MGNSKSRQANPAGQSRKQAKHASKNINNSSKNNHNNHNNGPSTHDAFSSQPITNDSGHYSIHGSTVAPGLPGGAFHNNLSSPGRLDQQKKASDSSLRLQYGSRVKRATVLGPGPPPDTDYPINSSNISNEIKTNSQRLRSSGLVPRTATAMSTGELSRGLPEMSYQHQQWESEHQQQQMRASPISMRQSQGRNSALASPSPAQYSASLNYQPHTQYHSQPHQQQQQQRMSMASPAPINGHRDEESKGKRGQMSSDFMDIPHHQRPSSFQNGYGHHGGQSQQQLQQSNSYHPSSLQHQQQPIRQSKADSRIRSDYNNYANNNNHNSNTIPLNNNNNTNTLNYNTDSSNLYVTAMESMPLTKTADMLAQAGPLIENPMLAANKAPAADQVFARLVKQYPTNPRETDKRERIYRWLDDVANALTFNPDTDTPGWVIHVTPDELDHPDSPFYMNRITFELDLMAPVGKPFRKVIDINCSSGEWAMDMAIKHPRTIVYALDPMLDVARLPQRIPDNCKFKLRDVKDQEGEFDLVHQRLGAFRTQFMEWTPHFAELGRLTRPGGWIQLAESNGMVVRAGVESLKVNRWVETAALSSGLNPMQMVEALMPTILGAGLINVECYEYGIPMGEWAGRRGNIAMQAYLSMVESLREEIIEINRLEEGIFEKTIGLMVMECAAENAELVMKVICAQKPPFSDDIWR
ncbi:hypothetical protein BG015_010553 [Linnemannia schmuckeri]|uniref:Methyltransferase domain-containing protein n=1 Tax=Linnemannia schmuckeri TaxID=64567 RepID=A0A9P5S4X1_9FUNG|nr:hypothetical protein BG015_010553 [Linnemannia schmuckeri]